MFAHRLAHSSISILILCLCLIPLGSPAQPQNTQQRAEGTTDKARQRSGLRTPGVRPPGRVRDQRTPNTCNQPPVATMDFY
jgi:hypothetical protein